MESLRRDRDGVASVIERLRGRDEGVVGSVESEVGESKEGWLRTERGVVVAVVMKYWMIVSISASLYEKTSSGKRLPKRRHSSK